jgi:hypothetical protein
MSNDLRNQVCHLVHIHAEVAVDSGLDFSDELLLDIALGFHLLSFLFLLNSLRWGLLLTLALDLVLILVLILILALTLARTMPTLTLIHALLALALTL